MERMTNKNRAKVLAGVIWNDPRVELFTCDYGRRYGFAIANDIGSAERSLTPYKPIKELVAYLEGVLATLSNPQNYQSLM